MEKNTAEEPPKPDWPEEQNPLEALKQALQTQETKNQDLTHTLQRLQAEFDNYRKRLDLEIEEKKQAARGDTLKKLLPVLDSFEHALKQNGKDEGLKRLYAQLIDTLEQEGLQPLPTQGKFNPYHHEALLTEKSNQEEGTILEELQKGYTYQGKILRTSKVKVSTK